MRIKFINAENTSVSNMKDKLQEVIRTTILNLQRDQDVEIEEATITEVQFTVGVVPEGGDEPQVLTVEHHEGFPEMFEWIVDLSEGKEATNKDKSFQSEQQVAMAKGIHQHFKEIESVYNEDDLKATSEQQAGDMAQVTYDHTDGFQVVRIYQEGRLVQEYKLSEQAEDVEDEPETFGGFSAEEAGNALKGMLTDMAEQDE